MSSDVSLDRQLDRQRLSGPTKALLYFTAAEVLDSYTSGSTCTVQTASYWVTCLDEHFDNSSYPSCIYFHFLVSSQYKHDVTECLILSEQL